MKKYILALILFVFPSVALADEKYLAIDKDAIGKMIREQIPDKLEGRALVNVTQVRPGRWRLGPIRNAIITRRRGPAPPVMGRTRTLMMKTTIYPGAGPMPVQPRGVQVQTPRVNVRVGDCKS